MIENSKVFFCNRECKSKYDKIFYAGEGNPNFKNSSNIVSLGSKIRNQANGKKWRKLVLQRDKNTCKMCGDNSKETKFEADHIYPVFRIIKDFNLKTIQEANENKILNDISNGRTLCLECHRKVKYKGIYRMAGKTPTQRTLEYYRNQNYVCDVVERWIRNPKHPAGGFRKDFLGFADLIALGEGSIIAIQSCGTSFSEHNKKILEDELVAPNAILWIESGGRLILIGWRKVKMKRGGKAMRYEPRIKEYSTKDFN